MAVRELPTSVQAPTRDASRCLPKVVAVICTYNGRTWLGDCLRCVLASDYPDFEVVVVDNGSSDGSAACVREEFPVVPVLEVRRNRGYAWAANLGMAYAAERCARYFLLLDDDAVVDPGAMRALVEVAQTQPRAGFVTGKVYFHDRPDSLQSVGKQVAPGRLDSGVHLGNGQRDVGQFEAVAERDFVELAYFLVARDVYDEVGGNDTELYFQGDDFEWQLRARKRGWKCYYAPAAKAWHRGSTSMGGIGSPISQYFFARSMLVVLYRHHGWRAFLRYTARAGTAAGFSLAKGLAQLDATKIKTRLAYCLGFWAGTWWLVHRRPATGVPLVIRLLA